MLSLAIYMGIMFVLMFLGLWISFAMGTGGVLALWQVIGSKTFSMIGMVVWDTCTKWEMVAVPLFVFLGEIMCNSGLMERLFAALVKVIRGLKGELVQANIVTSTVFAAIVGSTIASAAVIGRIAYPELVLKRGYDKGLVLGSIAAGGSLGILIPPSIVMIIYGWMSGASVSSLFIGGIIPGLMLAIFFMIYVAVRVQIQPKLVPAEKEKPRIKTRVVGVLETIPFMFVVLSVLGTIYGGISTPTESAAFGCTAAFILAIIYRRINWKTIMASGRNTVLISSMAIFILIAALVMTRALAYYRIPILFKDWGASIGSPWILMVGIIILYILLGCAFDGFAAVLLTLPFILPLVEAAGFDLVWFGIILVILLEMSALTPPIGINIFILQSVTGAEFWETTRGTMPFLIGHVILLTLLLIFPNICLWLPSIMSKAN